MKPATGKGLIGGGLVFQIALHDDIAAKHHLADCLAIMRDLLHGERIANTQALEPGIANALARLLCGTCRLVEMVPVAMPFIDDGRAIGFGQTIEMDNLEACLLHAGKDGFGRWRSGGVEGHCVRKLALVCCWRIEQCRHDNRRATKMGHPFIGNRVIHLLCPHPAQADMGRGGDGQRPGEAPAIAVEHRQRPQIDRMLLQSCMDRVGIGHQCRAPIMVDDTLRIARRAGRVVERDRIPFVIGHGPLKFRRAGGDKRFVVK